MSLLELALAEDGEAWERIVFLYSPLVERWCRRRHLREDEVLDLGQDVFLTLYMNPRQFRKDRPDHGFRKWLRTLTENKVTDYLKKHLRHPLQYGFDWADGPDGPGSDVEPDGDEDERLVVMRQCLEIVRAEFEPRTFEAFRLVTEGRSPAEVASTLSTTTGAVYTARSRVTKRLKELLLELEEDLPGL